MQFLFSLCFLKTSVYYQSLLAVFLHASQAQINVLPSTPLQFRQSRRILLTNFQCCAKLSCVVQSSGVHSYTVQYSLYQFHFAWNAVRCRSVQRGAVTVLYGTFQLNLGQCSVVQSGEVKLQNKTVQSSEMQSRPVQSSELLSGSVQSSPSSEICARPVQFQFIPFQLSTFQSSIAQVHISQQQSSLVHSSTVQSSAIRSSSAQSRSVQNN